MSCKDCGGCSGCGGCGGCGALELTEAELQFLRELGQFAFLPVARKAEDMTPVYLEDTAFSPEEYSLILQCLEKKNLIHIDYDAPLAGADMQKYVGFPVHGSIALTARGQQVLETLEISGISQ